MGESRYRISADRTGHYCLKLKVSVARKLERAGRVLGLPLCATWDQRMNALADAVLKERAKNRGRRTQRP